MYVTGVNGKYCVVSATGQVIYRGGESLRVLLPTTHNGSEPAFLCEQSMCHILSQDGIISRAITCDEARLNALMYGYGHGVMPFLNMDGKWGYIDIHGDWVIEPQFDCAYPFYNGVALVGRTASVGVIDMMGRQIASFRNIGLEVESSDPSEWDPSCFAAMVKSGNQWRPHLVTDFDKFTLLKGTTDIYYTGAEVTIGRCLRKGSLRYDMWNRLGEKLVEYKEYLSHPSDRLVCFQENKNDPFGMMNMAGEIVMQPSTRVPGRFLNGWAHHAVRGKSIIVDRTLKVVMKASRGVLLRSTDGVVWSDTLGKDTRETVCINNQGRIVWKCPRTLDAGEALIKVYRGKTR